MQMFFPFAHPVIPEKRLSSQFPARSDSWYTCSNHFVVIPMTCLAYLHRRDETVCDFPVHGHEGPLVSNLVTCFCSRENRRTNKSFLSAQVHLGLGWHCRDGRQAHRRR